MMWRVTLGQSKENDLLRHSNGFCLQNKVFLNIGIARKFQIINFLVSLERHTEIMYTGKKERVRPNEYISSISLVTHFLHL